MRRALLWAGLLVLGLWAGAHAEATLPTVTVKASPIIEANVVDRYASTSTVVSRQQMDDLNAGDLTAALRRTPGVTISRYNPVGAFGGAEGGGIFIRGLGSSRPGGEIKTFIDGVPLYMGVWNHPLLDLISIDPAESVQVFKSPQPQVFGNALAAVNLVPTLPQEQGFATRIHGQAGSHDTLVEKVQHSGRSSHFAYTLTQSYRISSGHRDRADGYLTAASAAARSWWDNGWYVGGLALTTDNKARDPGVEGLEATTRQGTYKTNAALGSLTLGHELDKLQGSLKLYANTGEGAWTGQRPPDRDTISDFSLWGLRWLEVAQPWAGGDVRLGIDWDTIDGSVDFTKASGAQSSWEAQQLHILSPYVAVSHTWGDPSGWYCTPSIGARMTSHNEFDATLAPHAGIIVGYGPTQLHAGYSRGVLYPGLEVQVVSQAVLPALGKSWKNLDPEIVDHLEVGLRHDFGNLARVEATFFQNDGRDRYVIVPAPPFPPRYDNVEDYTIQGAEFALTLWPLPGVSLFGGITLLDPEPSDLPYAPHTSVSLGGTWQFWDNWRLSVDGQYVSSMTVGSQARRANTENTKEVDAYTVVNARLGSTWDWAGTQTEVFVAAENIFDADYEYQPGYPMPGATAMVGVDLRF
jgi:outer membrane receptor protein involved in Fe transport